MTNVEKHLRTPSEHVGRAHEGFDGIINSIKNNDFQTVEMNGYQRVENQTVELTNQSTTKLSRLPISRKHLYKFISTKQSIFIKYKFRLFGSH